MAENPSSPLARAKRGLEARRQEYRALAEAAGDGSTQAKVRLKSAKFAVQRQERVARGLPAVEP